MKKRDITIAQAIEEITSVLEASDIEYLAHIYETVVCVDDDKAVVLHDDTIQVSEEEFRNNDPQDDFHTLYYKGDEPSFVQLQNVQEMLGCEISVVGYENDGVQALNVYCAHDPKAIQSLAATVAQLLDLKVVEV